MSIVFVTKEGLCMKKIVYFILIGVSILFQNAITEEPQVAAKNPYWGEKPYWKTLKTLDDVTEKPQVSAEKSYWQILKTPEEKVQFYEVRVAEPARKRLERKLTEERDFFSKEIEKMRQSPYPVPIHFNEYRTLERERNEDLERLKSNNELSGTARSFYEDILINSEEEFQKIYKFDDAEIIKMRNAADEKVLHTFLAKKEPSISLFSRLEEVQYKKDLTWWQRLFNWFKPKTQPGLQFSPKELVMNVPQSTEKRQIITFWPRVMTPSKTTIARAQKLRTQQYNPAPVSASKALKQAERFGIGYQ